MLFMIAPWNSVGGAFFSVLLILVIVDDDTYGLVGHPRTLARARLSSLLAVSRIQTNSSPKRFILSKLSDLPRRAQLAMSTIQILASGLTISKSSTSLLCNVLTQGATQVRTKQ